MRPLPATDIVGPLSEGMNGTEAEAGTAPALPDESKQGQELAQVRAELLSCLKSRSAQIERELVANYEKMDPRIGSDPECLDCVLQAVSASVELAAAIIEQGEGWEPDLPPPIQAMARMLARKDFRPEAIARGTHNATSVFLRFLCDEYSGSPPDAIHYLFAQARRVEQLVSEFAFEYRLEQQRVNRPPAGGLAESVEGLLAGKPIDQSAWAYDLESWHLGLIAAGGSADLTSRGLAERLGCRLLFVPRETDIAWVWLGADTPTSFGKLQQLLSSSACGSLSFAAGEPRQGPEGWRLTHREARIALGIIPRAPRRLTRCTDVLLPAAVVSDDEIRSFLHETYLAPLHRARDAEALCKTLRKYFECVDNAASTAAALGVDRHTVQRRLSKIERILGRPLDTCRAELDVSLRMDQLYGAESGTENINS